MFSLSTATVSLPYVEFSTGADSSHPPVVFLHGLLGNKRNFASVATSLAAQLQRPRRILALDLRNHGDHSDWKEDMTYESMASDVVAFLDAQGISEAVLVGHSMGGKVAQAVALLHPHRVDGLCVLDIAPVAYSADESHWKTVSDIIHVLNAIEVGPETTKKDVDAQLRKTLPDPALRAFCLTNFDRNQWKIPLPSIAASLEDIAGFDVEGTYEGDTFFIHGGQSKFVRHAYMDAIRSSFPNHMLTTIRGSGHWVHAEAPEDTIALLKRFLDR